MSLTTQGVMKIDWTVWILCALSCFRGSSAEGFTAECIPNEQLSENYMVDVPFFESTPVSDLRCAGPICHCELAADPFFTSLVHYKLTSLETLYVNITQPHLTRPDVRVANPFDRTFPPSGSPLQYSVIAFGINKSFDLDPESYIRLYVSSEGQSSSQRSKGVTVTCQGIHHSHFPFCQVNETTLAPPTTQPPTTTPKATSVEASMAPSELTTPSKEQPDPGVLRDPEMKMALNKQDGITGEAAAAIILGVCLIITITAFVGYCGYVRKDREKEKKKVPPPAAV